MVKFKYYKTGATYSAATDVASDDIIFIEDGNKLVTHGHDYVFGNAYADMWLQQAALGSTTEPVYLSAKGTFSKASKYAGGTLVTLNGSGKGASTASFYAPTGAGTSGYVLKSSGSGAPDWSNVYVTSVGGKYGDITLDTTTSTAKAVKFAIDSNGKITGSVQGLGTAATTNSTAYATAAQGTKADNAMPKSGGTFTGAVTLNADPTSNLHAATKQYVDNQITTKIAAADAMVFKGTLGTGGTVDDLPTTGVVVGDTYKVIVAGTYAGEDAKIGDLFIATAATPTWAYVPSGDETVTTIKTGTSNLSTTAQSGNLIVGTAATKAFETTLTNGGNLPTGAAVKAFVEGKNYVTSSGITSITGQKGVTATTSGGSTTVKASLVNETANSASATRSTSTDGGLYAVELDKDNKLAVRVPWKNDTYTVNNGTFSVKTKVGSAAAVTAADFTANQSGTDDVTFIQGSNVTLTTDTTNRTITIAATQPTVNNGTLTIKGNSTSAATFSANQSGASNLNFVGSGTAASGAIVTSVSGASGTITISAQMEWAEYN